MKTATLLVVTLCTVATGWADFSYTTTRKSTGPTAGAAPPATKHYYKGQKMMIDSGTSAMLLDFDAQTVTNIQKAAKTYSVMKFGELGQAVKQTDIDAKVDVKETGQKKTINGFTASEVLMTMEIESAQASQSGMKMQMEISSWMSSEVPGAKELKAFHEKNARNFPWAAMGGGTGSGMQKAMADIQRKMAGVGGVPLLQVVKTKAGGPQAPQMQAGMAQARAQMEAVVKQGGPGAAAAQQALARMGGGATGGGSLFEVTTESSDFSTESIPDSVFAIPAGFQKK